MKRILYCRIKEVLDRYGIRPRPLIVEDYLGAQVPEVLDFIQKKFTLANGFTWENYGALWQLDHIRPIGRHNDSVATVVDKLHYTNLQPLDRVRNAAKAANSKDGDQERVMFRRNWFAGCE